MIMEVEGEITQISHEDWHFKLWWKPCFAYHINTFFVEWAGSPDGQRTNQKCVKIWEERSCFWKEYTRITKGFFRFEEPHFNYLFYNEQSKILINCLIIIFYNFLSACQKWNLLARLMVGYHPDALGSTLLLMAFLWLFFKGLFLCFLILCLLCWHKGPWKTLHFRCD